MYRRKIGISHLPSLHSVYMKWSVAQSYQSPTFLQTTLRFGEGDESDSCLGIPCVGVAVAPHATLHQFDSLPALVWLFKVTTTHVFMYVQGF